MADKIRLARGCEANMPILADGEPGFATDTEQLFVGNGGKNAPIRDKETLKLVEKHQTAFHALELVVEEHDETLKEQGTKIEEYAQALAAQGEKFGEIEAALDGKLDASAVAAQDTVAADAELGTVIGALNALIEAMKASGVMQE